MINTEDILSAARGALGMPFRHQGRFPSGTLDCAGLAIHVARSLNLPALDIEGYGRRPREGQLEEALAAQPSLMRLARPAERQAGDLLLMRVGRDPQHLAIFTGNGIIHAASEPGKCCEHDLSDALVARIVAAYRFVEAEQ